MALEDRNLAAGTVLTATYKKKERKCEVVQREDGLRYVLDDGTEHKSPSSAGKAAMSGVACNGWRFWSIAGTEAPKREPKVKAEKPAKAKAPAKTKNAQKRGKGKGKAVRAASNTNESFGCGVCNESFPTMKAATKHAMTHTA